MVSRFPRYIFGAASFVNMDYSSGKNENAYRNYDFLKRNSVYSYWKDHSVLYLLLKVLFYFFVVALSYGDVLEIDLNYIKFSLPG